MTNFTVVDRLGQRDGCRRNVRAVELYTAARKQVHLDLYGILEEQFGGNDLFGIAVFGGIAPRALQIATSPANDSRTGGATTAGRRSSRA